MRGFRGGGGGGAHAARAPLKFPKHQIILNYNFPNIIG